MKTVEALQKFEVKFKILQEKVELKPTKASLQRLADMTKEREELINTAAIIFRRNFSETKKRLQEEMDAIRAEMLRENKENQDRILDENFKILEQQKIDIERKNEEFHLNLIANLETFNDQSALFHADIVSKYDIEAIVHRISNEIRGNILSKITPVITNLGTMLNTAKTYHAKDEVIQEAVDLGLAYNYKKSIFAASPELANHSIVEKLKLYGISVQVKAF